MDKLDKEELFHWLTERVDEGVAVAIKDNGLSGASLVDLADDELKEVLPKVGHRKEVKKLIDDFKGSGPGTAQTKVSDSQYQHQSLQRPHTWCFDCLTCANKSALLSFHLMFKTLR